ncbi:MAG: flavodoxin [Candidatus Fimousia sp.]
MKKYLSIVLGIILTACMVACGSSSKDLVVGQDEEVISNQEVSDTEEQETSAENQQTDSGADSEQENEEKIAVVYFSGTGNTREVANLLAEEAAADIFEIIPENMYTSDDLNYNDDNCRANQEMNDDSARPAISNDLSVVSEYDVIYLGYPIWWGTAPRIIQTFIESYDISGATVYTFCTSGGSGIENSISDLQKLYPDVNIVDGKRLNDATESDIREWIESFN